MNKVLLTYLETHQSSMLKLDDSYLFLKTLELKQIVYIITHRVYEEDLEFIKKQLEADRYIGLYTNLNASHSIKESFREIAVLEDDEKTARDKKFFYGLNKVLWAVLALMTLLFLVSFGLQWAGYPITVENDTFRIFLPLLIIYGLFVGIDAIRLFLVKNQTINTYLQLNLFKPRRYSLKIRWYYVDQKELYLKLDKSYLNLTEGWYRMDNARAVDVFFDLLQKNTPLPKGIGLNENQVLVWLYEE